MPDISSMMMRNLNCAPSLRCSGSAASSMRFSRSQTRSRDKLAIAEVGVLAELLVEATEANRFVEHLPLFTVKLGELFSFSFECA